jgi:putative ABC transport system permease protein
MELMRQSVALCVLSLSTLRQRMATSLTIVASMAIVTGVLISTLSVSAGIVRQYHAGLDPNLAIVLPADSLRESSNGIPGNEVGIILDAPGIARTPNSKLLGDAELMVDVNPARRKYADAGITIRGVRAAGMAIRPDLHLIAGRMFQSGRRELIIGSAAEHVWGLSVGDTVAMRDGPWPIVGAFEAEGVAGDEFMGDADTIAAILHNSGFGSVHVRLSDPGRIAAFRHWLTTNPALRVSAETQSQYYDRLAADQSQYFIAMAYFAGTIMSIGALFGSINVMYGVVAARTREMAILRAMGYDAFPVAGSVVGEALFLSAFGAALGTALAWLLFDGHEVIKNGMVFKSVVSGELILLGVAWISVLALLGSAFPAIRAGRLHVVAALRAA